MEGETEEVYYCPHCGSDDTHACEFKCCRECEDCGKRTSDPVEE